MKKSSASDNINHIYISLILFLLVLPPFKSVQANGDPTLPTPPSKTMPESPLLSGEHYRVYCFEDSHPSAANTPQVLAPARAEAYQLRYQDRLFDLQEPSGFRGYFALDRWRKHYGDGGVDVTGAPNVVLVEGADATLIKLANRQPVTLSIDVPAEGYVRFDWKKIGGSYFSLAIEAGEQRFELDQGRNGYYISPLLQAGDRLRLVFYRNQITESATEILLNGFNFYSNAVQVVMREWQALARNDVVASFTQLISLESFNLDRVIFPENFQGLESSAIYQPEALIPEITGFPYVDEDADLSTEEDRFYLESSNCSLEITWEDELMLSEGYWTVLRHWRIKDLVYENVMERTQRIQLFSESLPEDTGHSVKQQRAPERRDFLGERPVIQYLEWEAPKD